MRIVPIILLISGLVLSAPPPKDMSADAVMLSDGQTMETMRVYISGLRSRTEGTGGSGLMAGSTSIVRRDRGVVWTLYPEKRQYMERPLDARYSSPDMASEPPGMISKERAGSSTVSGYPCTVYRMKVAAPGGRQLDTTACVSETLNLALRSEVMGITTELRNIRVGPQPASLFEIPSGYRLTTAAVPPNVKLPANMPAGMAEKMRQAAGRHAAR